VEPDYLPDLEVLAFSRVMKYLHPRSVHLYPSGGSGAKPPKQKLPYKSIL
jgi:hypothetical protein